MFFIGADRFLKYTAEDSASPSKKLTSLPTLETREDPQRDIPAGNITFTFSDGAPPVGDYYRFMDGVVADWKVVQRNDWDLHMEPNLRRDRKIETVTFDGSQTTATLQLPGVSDIGTVQFFKKSDVVTTDRSVFLTYPFEQEIGERALVRPRADGGRRVVQIGDEPRLSLIINMAVAADYADYPAKLEEIQGVLGSGRKFFFWDEIHPWSFWLMRKEAQRSYKVTTARYNRMSVNSYTAEVL